MKRLIILCFCAVLASACSDASQKDAELQRLVAQLDSVSKLQQANTTNVHGPIATFLTFQNSDAEEAMNFYVSLFENSRVIDVQRYGNEGPAKEGTIMKATFELNGSSFICSDSYIKHEWNFTPGVSIWVDCQSEEELDSVFAQLSENGNVFMPLNNYGFSQKFGFVEDRFGVSWQLNWQ